MSRLYPKRVFTSLPWLLAAVLVLGPVAASARAETLEEKLAKVPGYRFQKVEERTPAAGRIPVPLGPAALEECELNSYSRWRVFARETGSRLGDLEAYHHDHILGAYSLFSLERDRESEDWQYLDLSVDNRYGERRLTFWGGNYVFRLRGPPGEAEIVRNIASQMVEAVPLESIHPVTVLQLPPEDLLEESVRFYLGSASLEQDAEIPAWLVEELGFEDSIEVTSARYGPDRRQLLLIGYPTPALATDYFRKLFDALNSQVTEDGIFMKRSGILISIFFGPEPEATEVLSRVEYAAGVQWLHDRRPPPPSQVAGFLGFVAQAIVATAAFILITLTGGLLLGLVRYRILEHFPRLWKRDEMVRLRLVDR